MRTNANDGIVLPRMRRQELAIAVWWREHVIAEKSLLHVSVRSNRRDRMDNGCHRTGLGHLRACVTASAWRLALIGVKRLAGTTSGTNRASRRQGTVPGGKSRRSTINRAVDGRGRSIRHDGMSSMMSAHRSRICWCIICQRELRPSMRWLPPAGCDDTGMSEAVK